MIECTCKASEMPFGRCCKADDDDRKKFESWANEQGWNLGRNDENDYITLSTRAAYGAWIAGVSSERAACHGLTLLNGANAPEKGEWDMAQSIARAIRYRGKF